MRFCIKSSLICFASSILFFNIQSVSASNEATVVLSGAKPVNIVIMMDLSGSTSAGNLFTEKNAAKTLIRDFEVSKFKPRVAIGTFNYNPGASAAVILKGGELTSSYGTESPSTGLYQAIDSILLTGGYTDLSAAIGVAQGHITSLAQPDSVNYIVLISDGIPNSPGTNAYGLCENVCDCDTARSSTNAAATAAEQAGTTVIGIHYIGEGYPCPKAGDTFMKNEVSTTPNYYFDGNKDLSGIFAEVSCAIGCDDGNPCTKDTCNSNSGVCESTAVTDDFDSDGVSDCKDQCLGDDNLIGTDCTASPNNVQCQSKGLNVCGPEHAVVCKGSADVDLKICYGCSQSDVSKAKNDVLGLLNTHVKTFKKLASRILVISRNEKNTKKLVRTLLKEVTTLNNAYAKSLASIPTSSNVCKDLVSCPLIDDSASIEALKNAETIFSKHSSTLGKRMLKKFVKKMKMSDYKLIQSNVNTAASSVQLFNALPRAHSSCGF